MRPSSDDARRPSVGRLSLSVKIQQWRTAHPPVAGVTLGCSGCSVSRVAVQCGAGAGSRGVKAIGDRVGEHPSILARALQCARTPTYAIRRLLDDHRYHHHRSYDPVSSSFAPYRSCLSGCAGLRSDSLHSAKSLGWTLILGVAHLSGASGQLRECRGILAYTPAASSLYRCSPTTNWALTAPLASHWTARRILIWRAATC